MGLVRKEDQLIKAHYQARNEGIDTILHHQTKWKVGDWVWVYDSKSSISAGGKAAVTWPEVRKEKLKAGCIKCCLLGLVPRKREMSSAII